MVRHGLTAQEGNSRCPDSPPLPLHRPLLLPLPRLHSTSAALALFTSAAPTLFHSSRLSPTTESRLTHYRSRLSPPAPAVSPYFVFVVFARPAGIFEKHRM